MYGITTRTWDGSPADVIGSVERAPVGNLILRIGRTLPGGGWEQTAHVVLDADDERTFLADVHASGTT